MSTTIIISQSNLLEIASAFKNLTKAVDKILTNSKAKEVSRGYVDADSDVEDEASIEEEEDNTEEILRSLAHDIKYDFEINKETVKAQFPGTISYNDAYNKISVFLTYFRNRFSQNMYKVIIQEYPKFSVKGLPMNKNREKKLREMLQIGAQEDLQTILYNCVKDMYTTTSDIAFATMLVETIITHMGKRGRPGRYRELLKDLSSSIEIVGIEDVIQYNSNDNDSTSTNNNNNNKYEDNNKEHNYKTSPYKVTNETDDNTFIPNESQIEEDNLPKQDKPKPVLNGITRIGKRKAEDIEE